MESLDKLKEAVRGAIQRDFDAQSRRKVKKELLDALDAKYSFELPPSLVEQEFTAVWAQVEGEMKNAGQDLRGRGHDRGGGAGRLPRDRRAPRSARPGPCADRREGRYQDFRRRGHAGPRRAGPPVSRPGAPGLGVLPEESPGPRRDPGALCSRRRSSTTSSAQVKVDDETVSKEALFSDDEADEADSKPSEVREGEGRQEGERVARSRSVSPLASIVIGRASVRPNSGAMRR